MKTASKREHVRIFGQLGEIFGDKIIPFLPKILQFYQKKFRDIDPLVVTAFAESMGTLYCNMLRNIAG